MLNIDYFSILKEIDSLFNDKLYRKEKSIEKESTITMSFITRDNIEDRYRIKIHNHDYIEVTIPIKDSNYKYTTYMYNIENVYNYLYLHTHAHRHTQNMR